MYEKNVITSFGAVKSNASMYNTKEKRARKY